MSYKHEADAGRCSLHAMCKIRDLILLISSDRYSQSPANQPAVLAFSFFFFLLHCSLLLLFVQIDYNDWGVGGGGGTLAHYFPVSLCDLQSSCLLLPLPLCVVIGTADAAVKGSLR